jgi:spore coat polysaccharide biosynthesis protein SpsF
MTSSRLPGKVLADLCGEPLLARMLERVGRARGVDSIVVATTSNAADDPVSALCGDLGVESFRGDEADVLGRFSKAAAAHGADAIVRLTADCPLHDPSIIDRAVEIYRRGDWDYVSNVNRRSYPKGLDVEVLSAEALAEADRRARHPFLREHVTPFIRGLWPDFGSGEFRRADLIFNADFSHVRWTVDTAADLEVVRELWREAPEDFTWLQALAAATRKPHLLNYAGLDGPEVSLRAAELRDAELLFNWVNEPSSLAGKLKTRGPIEWDVHLRWCRSRLSDPASRVWIAHAGGLPVGQTRLERAASGELQVDVYVPPHQRRRGYAIAMLKEAAKAAKTVFPGEPLTALVRTDNPGSARLFSTAGYVVVGTRDGVLVMRRDA